MFCDAAMRERRDDVESRRGEASCCELETPLTCVWDDGGMSRRGTGNLEASTARRPLELPGSRRPHPLKSLKLPPHSRRGSLVVEAHTAADWPFPLSHPPRDAATRSRAWRETEPQSFSAQPPHHLVASRQSVAPGSATFFLQRAQAIFVSHYTNHLRPRG